MWRTLLVFSVLGVAACNTEVYVRDGVTDGDTFTLAPRATLDDDPVLQSWVSYSLARSTCQLQAGGPNPARANSFACELLGRRHLLATWQEQVQQNLLREDRYLDQLLAVQQAGLLPAYVAYHLSKRDWVWPDDVDLAAFKTWQREYQPRHRVETRLIGSWSYATRPAEAIPPSSD